MFVILNSTPKTEWWIGVVMKNYNQHNLVTFSNSILKHFGVKPFHQTEEEVDKVLEGHKKVALILFDGMGQNIVRKHLKEDSFIRQHYLHTIHSTFPPTTSAATTAFLTAKYPIETGWMSWAQYFDKYQRNIILFKNVDYNTGEKVEPANIANDTIPIKTILELIKENNKDVHAFSVRRYPVDEDGPKTLRQFEKRINKTLKGLDECVIYFYFDSPDYEMHEFGIDNKRVHKIVNKINKIIKRVCKKNPDTLFFTFADHGHINVKFLDFCEHEDLYSLLAVPMSFEKRTPTFFVKEGKQKEFRELFLKYYGEHFILLSKEEALKDQIFGEGETREVITNFIGDFVATSIDEYCLYASKEMKKFDLFKGHHAGNTQEEMLIDISAYNV